jgi:predicted permease
MTLWHRMVSILTWIVRRNRAETRLDVELREYMVMAAAAKMRDGVPRDEAQRLARLELGGLESVKERVRGERHGHLIDEVARDARYALRMFARTPVGTAVVLLTLALGIGANTAVFTLLHGLLLRSLPVAQPSQLARIEIVLPATGQESGLEWGMYQQILRRQRSFSQVSAWVPGHYEAIRDQAGTLRRYNVSLVSGDGFPLLGIRPHLGRLLAPYDDVRGGPPHGWSAVLSYGFWRDRFAGDPAIIGQRLQVGKTPVTVVGVAPADFQGVTPGLNPSLYLPYQMHATLDGDSRDVDYGCDVLARLAPGANLTSANAELRIYQQGIFEQFLPTRVTQAPTFRGARLQASAARTGFTWATKDDRKSLLLMQGLVAVVLLLCCINVAGLMLSKMNTRQHEFAIRKAIGGGRVRLTRQCLLESLLMAVAGATLGAVAAWFGSAALLRFFVDPNQTETLSLHPDASTFFVTAGLAICTTILCGIVPAWHAGRSDPGALLTSRTKVAVRGQLAGRAFVPIQVALSLVLVSTAGLLSKDLLNFRGEHLGFDAAHVTTETPWFYHQLPQKDDEAFLEVYQQIVNRLEELPGVESAAITGNRPTEHGVAAPFQDGVPGSSSAMLMAYNHVGPGYFRTMQTTVLAGREFDQRDRDRSVCMVNASAATHLFPRGQAISQTVKSASGDPRLPTAPCRVIGVAEDARAANLREPAPPTVYFPITKEAIAVHGNFTFLIRSVHAEDAAAAYRTAAAEIVPTVPVLRFATVQQQIDELFGRERLIVMMTNFFGALALLLSAIGLYGLLSSNVTQRRGEIGVRLALGARPGTVLTMILREAAALFSVGLVLGVVSRYAAATFVQKLLYDTSVFDRATLVATIGLLTVVGLLAAFLPARRASRVDPMVVLRSQ